MGSGPAASCEEMGGVVTVSAEAERREGPTARAAGREIAVLRKFRRDVVLSIAKYDRLQSIAGSGGRGKREGREAMDGERRGF
jgi:hypothetical protein